MPTTITRQPQTYRQRRTAASRWAAVARPASRKPYTRPEVTIGPRDEEDLVGALCARNPYM